MPSPKWLLLSLAALMLVSPVVSHAAKGKVPPGSFLTRPIQSAQDLARVIKQDPVVAKRYSSHFGMSPAALADYFSRCARVKTLTHSHRYTVYYISKAGKVVSRTRTIRAGSQVIVAWNGQPIMELRCGNPFLKHLPQPPTKVAEYKAETPPKEKAEVPAQIKPEEPAVVESPTQPEVTTAVEPPAPEAVPEPTVIAEVPPPVETKVLEAPPVELVPAEPPVVVPAEPSVIGAAKSRPSWLLPALIGVGAIGAISDGGGGGGGTPIPEPAGLAALAIGGIGIVCGAYRRRRR